MLNQNNVFPVRGEHDAGHSGGFAPSSSGKGVIIKMWEKEKESAARHAASLVQSGMVLGLGTGSTSAKMVHEVGRRVKLGELTIKAVCTSARTEEIARSYGIPLLALSSNQPIDLYLDGADEVDAAGRMIKGGGGALLREKLVASNSRRRVIMIDPSKRVDHLGNFPLPVETVRFGHDVIIRELGKIPGCRPQLRMNGVGEPYATDENHYITDCHFEETFSDPEALDTAILRIPGVVETGLFFGLCDLLVIGGAESARTEEFAPHQYAKQD